MPSPVIKVCCIQSLADLTIATNMGADALGFVSPMPSGPGTLSDEAIRELIPKVPKSVASFLLTCQTGAPSILEQLHFCKPTVLQLVDEVCSDTIGQIRHAMPLLGIVSVVHVVDDSAVMQSVAAERAGAHAILLDSGNPNLNIKELGGTGRVHNWKISRRIRDTVSIPVFLAGGLNPENVNEAIESVQPYGVDVCSGVRTEGRLDSSKLARFIEAVRSCDVNSGSGASFGTYGRTV